MRRLIDEKEYAKKHGMFLHFVDIEGKNGDATIDVYFYSHKSTPYVDKEEFYNDFTKVTGYGSFVFGHCYDDTTGYDDSCLVYATENSRNWNIYADLLHGNGEIDIALKTDNSVIISDVAKYI